MVEIGLRRAVEHEPDAAGVEEGEVGRGGEQELHAEGVAVEGGGAFDVVHDDGDLADAGEGEHGEAGGGRVEPGAGAGWRRIGSLQDRPVRHIVS